MNRILLITSATVGLVVGAVYAAITKMLVRAAKALIESNQRAVTAAAETSNDDVSSTERQFSESQKVKLPARIR
jgi:hypothetical protein